MKSNRVFYLVILLFIVSSCNENSISDNFIKDDMIFEFRNLSETEISKLEVLKKGTQKFEKFKWHLNNLLGFKKDEFSKIYPNYTLISDDLKVSIDLRKVQLEYIDSSNSIVKLKRDISVDEFRDFRYLIKSNDWSSDKDMLYGEGEYNIGNYTFCGLVPEEINYKYKVGKWKFWNLNKQLIAEGEFEIDSALALGRGGCNYMMKISKVIPKNWKFYDNNGNQINSNIEQIFRIENAQ